MEELPQTLEETFQEEVAEAPIEEAVEAPIEESYDADVEEEPQRKRGRPRMTPEQKKEAKAARQKLKVVSTEPKKEPKPPKIIERVVREIVEVPVPAPTQQKSPFEAIGDVLRNRAVSNYERRKQQWATFQFI